MSSAPGGALDLKGLKCCLRILKAPAGLLGMLLSAPSPHTAECICSGCSSGCASCPLSGCFLLAEQGLLEFQECDLTAFVHFADLYQVWSFRGAWPGPFGRMRTELPALESPIPLWVTSPASSEAVDVFWKYSDNNESA